MRREPGPTSVLLLIAILLFPAFAPILDIQSHAQSASQPTPPPPPTPQQLDQLLAPIALYPDALLAQITTASTNPQEILDVTNWLAKNPNLTGTALTDAAQKQGFDPAFLALVTFPTVLQMMADHIDDYAAIGQAMTANQAEVAASIQRLRSQAYAAGALRTNDKQTVEVQQVPNQPQPVYVIQPANPQVVYIPRYNPTVVYAPPSTGTVVATSLISFGVGIGIGVLLANNHPWDGAAGAGDGVTASTTTAAPGAESGSEAIVHPSTGITPARPTTSAVPDTAATGITARPPIAHPIPCTGPCTARPRTIRAILAIAHQPIVRQPIVLPDIARQRSSRFQAIPAIAHQTAPAPRPVSPELAHPTGLVLHQINPAFNRSGQPPLPDRRHRPDRPPRTGPHHNQGQHHKALRADQQGDLRGTGHKLWLNPPLKRSLDAHLPVRITGATRKLVIITISKEPSRSAVVSCPSPATFDQAFEA